MAKADEAIKDLQRVLGRLERLAGVVVRSSEGPLLLAQPRVRDPFALLTTGRAPSIAMLRAGLAPGAEPRRLTPAIVAKARHDLRALGLMPWLQIVRGSPRHFRRFGALDERWLLAQEARVDALARFLHPEPDGLDDAVVALVTDLHGAHAGELLDAWLTRSVAVGGRRRREAQRRIDGLAARLDDPHTPRREPPALAAMLDAAARELARGSGRAALRRFDPVLRRVLAWPTAPTHGGAPVPEDSHTETDDILVHVPEDSSNLSTHVPPDSSTDARRQQLAARVRARGAELVHALGSTRGPEQRAALRRILGAYVLAFPPRPGDPVPAALPPEEHAPAEQRLRAALTTGPLPALPLAQGLWLLHLPQQARDALAPWIAEGLAPALVEQVRAIEQLDRLVALRGDAALAIAYAQWLVRLVPHYRRLGVALDLDAEAFARLHGRGDLALLAHCLVFHHAPAERGAEDQLARLRATLGLFTARPRRAEALLADLSRAPAGLGRRLHPEFAAWLGEPALLDRFCHLCELAGEPPAISRALRRDFDRHARLTSQCAHLTALARRSPEQDARLLACERELQSDETTDRTWTLRRLAERCDEVQARAFARRLDDLLREVLASAIGVAPPALTPAWRDALRFYLGAAARNRGLLGDLLRFAAAAPGRQICPTLPRNRAWLARAAAHMRGEPWLAPRRRVLELGGRRHVLTVEDDPLEVLRMGIPFGTCLALDDGFNADSTVLNAVDINKRVLYVRDDRGSVVARKLIAVSTDFKLIGYRLYVARSELKRELGGAVLAMCRELADACGLPLASSGEPEAIHPGFWYDDGVVAWAGEELADEVAALLELAPTFTALGVAMPAEIGDWSRRELAAIQAHAQCDLEAALHLLPRLSAGAPATALADLIAARLGERTLAGRARREPALARVVLRQRAREGVAAVLRALPRVASSHAVLSEVGAAIEHAPPTAELVHAWISAVQHTRRRAAEFDDHGLEHRTFQIGPQLARLPVGEALVCIGELEPIWDWAIAEAPRCADCRRRGEDQLRDALEICHARAPDPAAVIAALNGRHGPLARRLALHLAARFSLSHRPCPLGPGLGASWVTRLDQRPQPAPAALRAVRELLRACPALASAPEMFAALVRQAGPEGPHTDLPGPDTSPIELLGELLFHLPDPAALLARWLEPGTTPIDWRPGPWELHLHRRLTTGWRRRLARLAPDSEHAHRWLGRLGDVAALTRIHSPGHLDRAREVAAQLTLADVPEDMSAALARAATSRSLHDAEAIDPLLLRAAARAFTPDPGPDLEHALQLFRVIGLAPAAWCDLFVRLLPPSGPPAPAVLPVLADLLGAGLVHGLPIEVVARLTAEPALRDALLVYTDAELRGYRIEVHPFISQLLALPCADPAARDELLAAVIVQAGDDAPAVSTPLGVDDAARLTMCIHAWCSRGTPALWLTVYRQLDLAQCAALLDALVALPPDRDPELATLRAAAREGWQPHGADAHAAATWLYAALDARLPQAGA